MHLAVATASQTIGPYWYLVEDKSWADLTRFGAEGERITLLGRVLDGDGGAVPSRSASSSGRPPPSVRPLPRLRPRGNRQAMAKYRFTTLKPGPLAGRGNTQQASALRPGRSWAAV